MLGGQKPKDRPLPHPDSNPGQSFLPWEARQVSTGHLPLAKEGSWDRTDSLVLPPTLLPSLSPVAGKARQLQIWVDRPGHLYPLYLAWCVALRRLLQLSVPQSP